MLNRKLIVASIVSIFAIVLCNIIAPVPSIDGGWQLGMLVYGAYTVPIIFIYGIATSIIADLAPHPRSSFLLHILCGASFIFPYGLWVEELFYRGMDWKEVFTHPILFGSILFAALFYFVDRVIKKKTARSAS